jgi:hypothetical protein
MVNRNCSRHCVGAGGGVEDDGDQAAEVLYARGLGGEVQNGGSLVEEHGGANIVHRLGGVVGIVVGVGVRCGLLLVDGGGGPFLSRMGKGSANTSSGSIALGGGLLLSLLSADQDGVALHLADLSRVLKALLLGGEGFGGVCATIVGGGGNSSGHGCSQGRRTVQPSGE